MQSQQVSPETMARVRQPFLTYPFFEQVGNAMWKTCIAEDLTVETPFGVWMDIMTGTADGQKMFMEQKVRCRGDTNLLLRLGELFSNR